MNTPAEPTRIMLYMMNIVWMIAGLGVFGAIAAIVRWRGSGRPTDLGFLSQQWLAENRLSQLHEPRR